MTTLCYATLRDTTIICAKTQLTETAPLPKSGPYWNSWSRIKAPPAQEANQKKVRIYRMPPTYDNR